MLSRFPIFSVIGAAGLAGLLLIPADPSTRPATGLAIGSDPLPEGTAEAAPMQATAQLPAKPAAEQIAPVTAPKPPVTVASIAPMEPTPTLSDTTAEPEPVATSAWVGGSAVNVRAGPSSSTAKLFVLQQGTKVAVTETVDGWSFVTDGSGESGWVYSRYLADQPTVTKRASVPTSDDEPVRKAKRKPASIGDGVVVRAGPSRGAPKLFVLRPGERIAVVETRGRWLRVVLESGASAWIDSRDLRR